MKTETRKVYFCDYCKKHNLSAASISRHEKFCRLNPANKHKCFALCVHLKRERAHIGYNHSDTVFTCEITKENMFSYIAEKKQSSYFTHPNMIKGLIRMPLECNLYKEMTLEEQEMRFGVNDD